MNPSEQRYLFVSFDVLKQIKYSQLSKVCDKAYVFIDAAEKHIPFKMVKMFQKMGKRLKWVEIEATDRQSLHYLMSFTIGKLHRKLNHETEFAILSNDSHFDALIKLLNDEDRYCVRVKQENEEEQVIHEETLENNVPELSQEPAREVVPNGFSNEYLFSSQVDLSEDTIDKSVENTIKRLIRSGNRPSSLYLLKEYILINNRELNLQEEADQVIQKLEETNEIKLLGEDIIYNF